MNDRIISGIGHRIPGEEITWAGRCPSTGELCFGTASGRLFLVPADTLPAPDKVDGPKVTDEPINAVAFSGELIGISSRSEVSIARRRPDGGLDRHEPFFDGGAHGIVPTSSGGFIASLGSDGLLLITSEAGKIEARVGAIEGMTPDFYRLTPLGQIRDNEVFACAARESGLLTITVQGGLVMSITGHQFDGIDLVDVCPLRSPAAPFGVVALNLDGNLLMTKNVLEGEPLILAFDELHGPAYSVLSAQGHVFVLTSTELVIFPDLVADFLAGRAMDRILTASAMPVHADEAFLLDEDAVLVTEDDKAVAHDIASMIKSALLPPIAHDDCRRNSRGFTPTLAAIEVASSRTSHQAFGPSDSAEV